MKEKIKTFLSYDVEPILLRKLSSIVLNLIIFLIGFKLLSLLFDFNFLDLKDLFTFVGALVAFWYGYKTYERNKELEIIDKYTSKYNEINSDLFFLKQNVKENREKIKRKYHDLFNLFYEEFFLKAKGYISDELWLERNDWIELDINDFLQYSIYELFTLDDSDIFLAMIYGNYLQQYNRDFNIKIDSKTFFDFISEKLLKIRNDFQLEQTYKIFNNPDKDYNQKMKDLILWIDSIIEVNENNINLLSKFNKLRNDSK